MAERAPIARRALALFAPVAVWAGLATCAPEDQARGPFVRFECQEGCGSYKTVYPGESPPPCCGLPMARAGERAGERVAPSPLARD